MNLIGIEIELVKKTALDAGILSSNRCTCTCYRQNREGCGEIAEQATEELQLPDTWVACDDCSFPPNEGVEIKLSQPTPRDVAIESIPGVLARCKEMGYVAGPPDIVGTHITLHLDHFRFWEFLLPEERQSWKHHRNIRYLLKALHPSWDLPNRLKGFRRSAPGIDPSLGTSKRNSINFRPESERLEFRCMNSTDNPEELIHNINELCELAEQFPH